MTTEISILNKNGVTIAADSAVTFFRSGRTKVFYNSQKIIPFKNHPFLACLVYGNASFMGVPVNLIIDMFDETHKKTLFKTVNDVGDSLIEYMEEFLNKNVPEKTKAEYLEERLEFEFRNMFLETNEIIYNEIKKNQGIKVEVAKKIILNMIEKRITIYKKAEFLPFLRENPDKYKETFLKKHEGLLVSLIERGLENTKLKEIFEDIFKGDKDIKNKLFDLAFNSLLRETILSDFSTGIVIVGYGEDEFFPAVINYEFEGMIGKNIKFFKNMNKTTKISIGDIEFSLNLFGDYDTITTFINGVNPHIVNSIFSENEKLYTSIIGYLQQKINPPLSVEIEKMLSRVFALHKSELEKIFRMRIDPFIQTIKSVSVKDLSDVAEMLLQLVAFEKKYTPQEESVGGKIAVATITKRDGFKWVKEY